ncbi:lytic transglycosylase domain-containing protein [Desulfobulbus sp.]|uniref:lytic transglycosylase domain-containing protein n=1 Tax=Desulfobulbus sp. TaxID=895 RepID=UPI0027BA6217|nr:lytic transglycosylase domain-containing protein [Desulfobulbus sp.]
MLEAILKNIRWMYWAMMRNAVWSLLCLLCAPTSGHGDVVESYVRKYQVIELSAVQKANVSSYEHLIHSFSAISYFRPRYKVSPDFIRALMLAESGGDTFAVSEKNALGLCQLLYPTAKVAARELLAKGLRFEHVSVERLRRLQPDDLFDPAVNILLTCYLISKYNKAYDGRLDLVVAAWNAGQGSIFNGKPPDYPETLDLIGKVNGYFLAFLKQRRGRQAG